MIYSAICKICAATDSKARNINTNSTKGGSSDYGHLHLAGLSIHGDECPE